MVNNLKNNNYGSSKRQKSSHQFTCEDMVLEIIYGCDRFDKYDVKAICVANDLKLEDLRKLTEEKVRKNYKEGDTWSEGSLQRQLNYWFK